MFNSLDVLDDLVASQRAQQRADLSRAEQVRPRPVIIIKRNKPSYVLMGINDYQDLLDRLEDTEDVRLAEKRIEDNNGRATIPNADLMAELGLTEGTSRARRPRRWRELAGRMARRSREGHAQTGQGRTETGAQRHRQGQRNPLPSSQGGYGKPLRNANRAHLAGLCKIKFRDLGIGVVYKPGEAYLKADERRGRHAL